MATLRALDTAQPLERFVELTKLIRTLEAERDGLKDTLIEALQAEPPGDDGQQSVDFDGHRLELATRPRWNYSDDVKELEKQVKELKATERIDGTAEKTSENIHVRCSRHRTASGRAWSEDEARARKVAKISDFIREAGVDPSSLAEMQQDERDDLARRAGQRTPSNKTWSMVIEAAAQKMFEEDRKPARRTYEEVKAETDRLFY